MTLPQSLEVIRDFVSKVVIAVVAFLVVGTAAIALNLFIVFAASRNLLPRNIVYGLTGLEYVIFALDLICFVYFLFIESFRFLRDVTALL
jgi:hypothetical protein